MVGSGFEAGGSRELDDHEKRWRFRYYDVVIAKLLEQHGIRGPSSSGGIEEECK
jgi:hypothetical protein